MEGLGPNRSDVPLGSIRIPANDSVGNASYDPPRQAAPGRTPKELELTVRILLYVVIFTLSVGGNLLIITVLGLSRRLRTVTNAFLLSLAVSDLLLAICCMPFTLLPNLMGSFVFGSGVCKAVAYLMGVSVSVSTFSLVAIALERYSAICRPLQARVWQTRSHAIRVIAATWLLAALLMLPYPIYSAIRPFGPRVLQCSHMWPSTRFKQAWAVLLLLLLFFIPGVVMAVAYGLISRELYLSMRFEAELQQSPGKAPKNGVGPSPGPSPACDEGDGCYLQLSKPRQAMELSALTPSRAPAPPDRARTSPSEAKLVAKKRVIRMLLVIVALFFLCWLPLYTANTWRAFDPDGAHGALSGTPISFIHLLSYTSACVNPLVYCFMNRRFRQACLATCTRCRPRPARPRPRPLPEDDPHTATTLSRLSYTTLQGVNSNPIG
ncbi:gastrin/cholecystokinin type B receptor [Ornithorhynchus anatinus]|nr:gastrin/cholecystokinin type B receptor [Ornithorhynchus anatinus]